MIKLKRVYETPDSDDGLRILVERLWPRGVSRKNAAIDAWMKDVAPSKNSPSDSPPILTRYD
jgi:uncharacterized protein YeaO (DUF488 family)